MSFYTIDGRFINKKKTFEGFDIIEHGAFGADRQDTQEQQEQVEQEQEEPVEQEPAQEPVEQNPVEDPVAEPVEEPTEEPVEEPVAEPVEEPVAEPAQEQMQQRSSPYVMRPREMPLTDEMRNERETFMHFCINKKCLTETELRKLNELYDKKCSN